MWINPVPFEIVAMIPESMSSVKRGVGYGWGVFFLLFCLISSAVAVESVGPLTDAIIALPKNSHAVVVEKQTQMIYVYAPDGANGVRVAFKAPCSTGEVDGPKKRAGDKKTPEGIYFLIDEYEDKYLSPVYGAKAFPTDYPNFMDRRMGKNGSAIWIHGTDKTLRPMESNGCVALKNSDITTLARYIDLHQTPLIVSQSRRPMDAMVRKRLAQELSEGLTSWARAVDQGSYHDFLSYYSDGFLPDVSFWEEWKNLRFSLVQMKMPPKIRLSNIGLYHHDGMYVALFDLSLTAGSAEQHLGRRQFFLVREGGLLKIVGDLYQLKGKRVQGTEMVPMVAAARQFQQQDRDEDRVLIMVRNWLLAWSAGDMDAYANAYSPDFVSDGMGKTAWVKRKRRLAAQYDFIDVSGREFAVIKRKYGYEVRFFQIYKSSGFSTDGIKQLKLKNRGGAWKIFQENWKKR